MDRPSAGSLGRSRYRRRIDTHAHATGGRVLADRFCTAPAPGVARARWRIPTSRAHTGSTATTPRPAYYGMAYGSPSVGLTRTYTAFSTPYGGGLRCRLRPVRASAGPIRRWALAAGVRDARLRVWRLVLYRSFPVPYSSAVSVPRHRSAIYAPGFGPPSPPSYYVRGDRDIAGSGARDRQRDDRPDLLRTRAARPPRPQCGGLGHGGDPDLGRHSLARRLDPRLRIASCSGGNATSGRPSRAASASRPGSS